MINILKPKNPYSKFLIICFFLLGKWGFLHAQYGSSFSFEFLRLPGSARQTYLGTNASAIIDADPSMAMDNPSALNPLMHNRITAQQNWLYAGVRNSYLSYARSIKPLGITAHAGFKYLDYGKFESADELGNRQGQFRASDAAFILGASKNLTEKWILGANIRYLQSRYEVYRSSAVTTDLALTYLDTARRTTISMTLNHFGSPLKSFTPNTSSRLPTNLQIAFSKKLKHLPFRYGVIAHHLQTWNLRYSNPIADAENTFLFSDQNSGPSNSSQFIDNVFRHLIFNGEFVFGKKENFRFGFGYNHYLRRDGTIQNLRSLAGLSFGLGLKLNRFRIDYGRQYYHLAGPTHHLGLMFDLDDF
jgi:hypothetical protein